MQYSTDIRDAQLDVLDRIVGNAPTMEVRTGDVPQRCADADAGTLLAVGVLPSTWMHPSAQGMKTKAGTWILTGQPGAGAGTPGGHFRIKVDGVCKCQGTFGAGQEAVPEHNMIADGQAITIISFCIERGNEVAPRRAIVAANSPIHAAAVRVAKKSTTRAHITQR